MESVDLYLSRAGTGGPWELLAAGAPNTGSYSWTVTGPAAAGTCHLRVDARDYAGNLGSDVSGSGFTIASEPAAVGPTAGSTTFALGPPAPNPVRGPAQIAYVVPRRSPVRLTLFDLQGRQVAVLAEGEHKAGRYVTQLNTRGLGAGLYFVRLQVPGMILRQRLVVLR